MPKEWFFQDLVAKLTELNKQWVNSLNEVWGPEGVTLDGSSDQTAAIKAQAIEGHCFCGLLKGAPQTAFGLARQCLIDPSHGKTLHGVLNVLDNDTQHTTQKLPVVVCVGINYGQIRSAKGTLIIDKTNMRRNLEAAAKRLAGKSPGCHCLLPDKFHLIATNVFPWLSIEEWRDLDLNAIQETLLLHCLGDKNPIARVASLLAEVGCRSVVFHGAKNCVSSLAIPTIRLADTKGWSGKTVLCDNLSRMITKNVVCLCSGRSVAESDTLDTTE